MKLMYRGVSYEHEPMNIDLVESDVIGHYRGASYKVQYPRHIPVPQSLPALCYRGVAYGGTAPRKRDVQPPVLATGTVTPPRPIQLNLIAEAARMHAANICRSNERRLQAAKARGDDHLVQLLEQELLQLQCSVEG